MHLWQIQEFKQSSTRPVTEWLKRQGNEWTGLDKKLHMLRCCLHVRSVCSEFFSCNFDIDLNGKSPKLWRTLKAGSPIFHRSQSGKVFWVQVLTKSRSKHLSSPLSQKENSLCQELLWCKCCFETRPAQKVSKDWIFKKKLKRFVLFRDRMPADLECSPKDFDWNNFYPLD